MKKPNPFFCLGVFLLRFVFMIFAPLLVGIGMLTGGIRPGPERYGQWAGTRWTPEGAEEHGFKVASIETSGFWNIYNLPDETGIGLYEKTVSKIFNKYGWKWTVYYQLAFRNVAQGFAYNWAVRYEGNVPAPQRTWRIAGIGYGWKQYEDWQAYTQEEILANKFAVRKYYSVPDFFVSNDDAN